MHLGTNWVAQMYQNWMPWAKFCATFWKLWATFWKFWATFWTNCLVSLGRHIATQRDVLVMAPFPLILSDFWQAFIACLFCKLLNWTSNTQSCVKSFFKLLFKFSVHLQPIHMRHLILYAIITCLRYYFHCKMIERVHFDEKFHAKIYFAGTGVRTHDLPT